MLRLMSVLLVIALLIPVMSCSISRSAGFEDISVEECYTLIQENQENPDFIIWMYARPPNTLPAI